MASLEQVAFLSAEEYLDGEQHSEVRHEYINGRVYVMAGGTKNHNLISLNVASVLREKLKGSPCTPFINDMKVRVQTLSNEHFYYPDVVVSCDPTDDHDLYLEKPTTIVEVLSQATERVDRNEKFLAYTSLESLQEYILVSQERKEVTIVKRSNSWKPEVLQDTFSLEIPSINLTVSDVEIYDAVRFE